MRASIAGLMLVLVGMVAGCASPARVDQMRADTPMATRTVLSASALREQIAIKEVTGGRETNPMWVSNVSSSDFERALEASLRDAGVLAAHRQAGRYAMTAHLMKLDQPLLGFSMTVTSTVQYTIVERSSGRTAWEQTVTMPFTAGALEAFLGSERLKLANEGSARKNIERFVELLAASPLATAR